MTSPGPAPSAPPDAAAVPDASPALRIDRDTAALLLALLGDGDDGGDGAAVSVPRLGKRLGQGASAVMRRLALTGDAALGGRPGPGWTRLELQDDRWMAHLTDAGRELAQRLRALVDAAPAADDGADRHGEGDGDDGDDGVPAPLHRMPVERHLVDADGAVQRLPAEADRVAAEVPVALVFNGISQAVMMCTPQDLEDFALGFALSEGILDSAADCRDIAVRPVAADCGGAAGGAAPFDEEAPAVEVHLEISARSFARLKDRRRTLAGRTGCGVCGVDSLAALDLVPERVAGPDWVERLDLRAVRRAFAGFRRLQPLNAQAGSLHAAGWARPDGELVEVLEDVGRHNALDKLLGRLARAGRLGGGDGRAVEPGFVVLSSRASYELVRKCARMGVPAMATISAPTGLAVRIAEQAGMRLWGLCRGDAAVLYAPVGTAAGDAGA